MATKRFRFQPLLDLRITQRDAVRGELAEAIEAQNRLREQRDQIAKQREQAMRDDSVSRVGQLKLDSLLAQGRYERQLAIEQNQLKAAEAQIEIEIERRRAAVQLAETEVRRLELLKEKDKIALYARQLKIEQVTMDEIAARSRETDRWE
ncbi:MAG TPA: flagellar export protein FliJ [Planctomycetaceae bacterium]|nr:flagellar export protein FliJ [Planctomycetaceae bacterium]